MVPFELEKPTAQEIAQHFSAAMDSVNLINQLNAKETLTDKEKDTIYRNKEHLKIMVGRDWFSDEQKATLSSVL